MLLFLFDPKAGIPLPILSMDGIGSELNQSLLEGGECIKRVLTGGCATCTTVAVVLWAEHFWLFGWVVEVII